MKKYIASICAILVLLLTACNNQTPPEETPTDTPTQSEQPTDNNETTPPAEEKNPINTMEKLADVDGVISVTKQTFSQQIKGAVAYKVLYESENGKLAADVVLPDDYANENKHYPVLIYFPQVGTHIESLASNYALNDIIVIRHMQEDMTKARALEILAAKRISQTLKSFWKYLITQALLRIPRFLLQVHPRALLMHFVCLQRI